MKSFEIHQKNGTTTTKRGVYIEEDRAKKAWEYLKAQDGKMPKGSGGVFELRNGEGLVVATTTIAEEKPAKA